MTIDACVTLGQERETVLSVEDLLQKMNRAGVDRAVIQPADRMLVVDNVEGNQMMLKMAKHHPDRLIASCTANPWFGQRAVDALLSAIEQGSRMIVFAPSLQGFILGDEILTPLLDAVAGKQIPIYVHTGPHLHSTPWQLANVAERHPNLPFLMGHSGATDFLNDIPNAASSMANIYLESSFARPFTMKSHLEKCGIQKGIMGSGAPRNDLEFEWQQMRMVFPQQEYSQFYGDTLWRLLQEVRP